MNIPEYEMKALFDWSTDELSRIESEYPDIIGALDGLGDRARKLHFAEYNNRLAALKNKYETVFDDFLQHA